MATTETDIPVDNGTDDIARSPDEDRSGIEETPTVQDGDADAIVPDSKVSAEVASEEPATNGALANGEAVPQDSADPVEEEATREEKTEETDAEGGQEDMSFAVLMQKAVSMPENSEKGLVKAVSPKKTPRTEQSPATPPTTATTATTEANSEEGEDLSFAALMNKAASMPGNSGTVAPKRRPPPIKVQEEKEASASAAEEEDEEGENLSFAALLKKAGSLPGNSEKGFVKAVTPKKSPPRERVPLPEKEEVEPEELSFAALMEKAKSLPGNSTNNSGTSTPGLRSPLPPPPAPVEKPVAAKDEPPSEDNMSFAALMKRAKALPGNADPKEVEASEGAKATATDKDTEVVDEKPKDNEEAPAPTPTPVPAEEERVGGATEMNNGAETTKTLPMDVNETAVTEPAEDITAELDAPQATEVPENTEGTESAGATAEKGLDTGGLVESAIDTHTEEEFEVELVQPGALDTVEADQFVPLKDEPEKRGNVEISDSKSEEDLSFAALMKKAKSLPGNKKATAAPVIATQMSFYQQQRQLDREEKQKQQDAKDFLRTYRNKLINFRKRKSVRTDQFKFSSYATLAELDAFFRQQHVLRRKLRPQELDASDHRRQTAGDGTETERDLSLEDFLLMKEYLDRCTFEAANVPLPTTPATERSLYELDDPNALPLPNLSENCKVVTREKPEEEQAEPSEAKKEEAIEDEKPEDLDELKPEDPDEPKPEDPDEPKPEDPDEPKPEDPDEPKPEDPDEPKPDEANEQTSEEAGESKPEEAEEPKPEESEEVEQSSGVGTKEVGVEEMKEDTIKATQPENTEQGEAEAENPENSKADETKGTESESANEGTVDKDDAKKSSEEKAIDDMFDDLWDEIESEAKDIINDDKTAADDKTEREEGAETQVEQEKKETGKSNGTKKPQTKPTTALQKKKPIERKKPVSTQRKKPVETPKSTPNPRNKPALSSAKKTPVQKKTPVVNRTSTTKKTPVQRKTPDQTRTPVQRKTPTQTRTPAQRRTPAQTKTPVQVREPKPRITVRPKSPFVARAKSAPRARPTASLATMDRTARARAKTPTPRQVLTPKNFRSPLGPSSDSGGTTKRGFQFETPRSGRRVDPFVELSNKSRSENSKVEVVNLASPTGSDQKSRPLYREVEASKDSMEGKVTCNNHWSINEHKSRNGCERCLYFATPEERSKFEEEGHHYRINLVTGGCSRDCKLFPRGPNEPPVRLCRKCFYDTHAKGMN